MLRNCLPSTASALQPSPQRKAIKALLLKPSFQMEACALKCTKSGHKQLPKSRRGTACITEAVLFFFPLKKKKKYGKPNCSVFPASLSCHNPIALLPLPLPPRSCLPTPTCTPPVPLLMSCCPSQHHGLTAVALLLGQALIHGPAAGISLYFAAHYL